MQPSILIVDDDTSHLASVVKVFERLNLRVLPATHGEEALETLRRVQVAVVLTDLMMPKMSGMDLLKHIKSLFPDTEVLMMTAYGTIQLAVEAMREGAYDFVIKPFRRAEIERVVKRALEKTQLLAENRALRVQLADARRVQPGDWGIIGNAPALRRVLEISRQAAPSSATVLLGGESGTGKELFARAIHGMSPRAERAFVAVNCGALPESIIEAELFGAEKGAYTGANTTRDGRFTRAHEGTLFLDEVAELSLHVQVKLLRALQSGEYERVGGSRSLYADCRIIAASNRDLKEAVKRGEFREDLYYRLHVIPITLPSLRERPDDIPILADHFLRFYAQKYGKTFEGISTAALSLMVDYGWPGNVRELENSMERAAVLFHGPLLEEEALPESILEDQREARRLNIPLGLPLEEIERRVIRETLRFTGGDKNRAAQLLGIAKRTIYRKLEGDKLAH